MANYLEDDYFNDVSIIDDPQSYLPTEYIFKTERGIEDEEDVPVLSGSDDVFSELTLSDNLGNANSKALDFVSEFTRVFAKKKTPDRSYSKFVQNKNELPDVELDWIFQYFRLAILFSESNDDYYCITKYDEHTGKYESKSGPLIKANYREFAEEVMQEVG